MATPDHTSNVAFTEHGSYSFPFGLDLVFADPIYADGDDPMQVVYPDPDWQQVRVFTLHDRRGTRALCVTSGALFPATLTDRILKGAFVILDSVGVDSGQLSVGVHVDGQRQSLHTTDTYFGDGVYPIAIWGKDGVPYAFAVLMDVAYYDPNW